MSGLPWIKVEVIAANHPKLQRLEKRLGIQDGLGVAVRLWCWTASYHPNGEVPLDSGEEMGAAAIGHVRSTRTVTSNADVTLALVEVGLVDKHDDRYEIHDWSLHQQAHADKAERDREQNRERQRRFRNRQETNKVTLRRNVTNNVTVTPCNGGEGEGEREGENTPLTPQPVKPKRQGAAVGVGHPAFSAVKHWREEAWPKRSPSPAADVTTAQAQRLAALCLAPGLGEVVARMDRAVVDPFWRDKLTLDDFLDKFDRFAAGKTAPPSRGPAPVSKDFTEAF